MFVSPLAEMFVKVKLPAPAPVPLPVLVPVPVVPERPEPLWELCRALAIVAS